jgi:tetratricopeptide (TPR) repeat protein
MDSYMCVLRGYGYRRTFLRAEFKPAMKCLEQAVERDPQYSDAWAMLGWLHLDAGRLSFIGDDQQKEYEKAQTAIARAIELQPKNPLALKALAAAHYFTGRYEDSERLTRQLVSLYPNDPEILAQLGWRLSVRGNFKEGVPALKQAIDRTLNPPNWYFHFIAVNHYLKGEYEEARRIAERAALGDSGFSQLILATSNAALGNREGTQQALEKLGRYEPLVRDTEGFLYRQGVATETVRALLAGLERARAIVSRQ